MSPYKNKGYSGREEYLKDMAEEYGVSIDTVYVLAEILGHSEDFDGLINALEDAEG